MSVPVRFGVVGIHGYSRSHINSIRQLAAKDPGISLAAAAAYERERDPAYAAELEASGVQLVPDVAALLALGREKLDVITVPTGIGLHVPMSIQALEAGFPVLVEKPVAGTVQEVDALIAARDRARQPVLVGYQWMYRPFVRKMKQAILDGNIGAVKEVRAFISWPRTFQKYYGRNAWAGKLKVGDTWVLDSPFNNACAHFVLLSLYLATGKSPMTAQPAIVSAELYRANPIDSPDTACIQVRTTDEVPILFLVTHAAAEESEPEIRIYGERGMITMRNEAAEMVVDGVSTPITDGDEWFTPFHAMAGVVRGEHNVPQCTLDIARVQTLVANAAHLSTGIVSIPESDITQLSRDGDVQYCVNGLYQALHTAFTEGRRLYEVSPYRWTKPGEWIEAGEIKHFRL